MAASWQFYPKTPTHNYNNPISGEFFSTESVREASVRLAREAIQNSLDARIQPKEIDGRVQPKEKARVRIYLSEMTGALRLNGARHWFGSLWSHVTAEGCGIAEPPDLNESCPYLVIEDFGTIGLTGDDEADDRIESATNHFFNFFRAEGHSDKGEQDRGSWGVGKIVFPRASRIRSFFGFTIRSDDKKQLLFGRSILKFHKIGKQTYTSAGYFGVRRDDGGFMLPCSDPATLAEFRKDFAIKCQNEPGLSIVVPWYDQNADDAITRDKILQAVLRGFFYPILMAHLSVTIATPNGETVLDASNIMQVVQSLGDEFIQTFLPLLELAEWANTRIEGEFLALNPPEPKERQKLRSNLVPETVIKTIQECLAERKRVAIRIPLSIRKKPDDGQEPVPTHFCAYFERCDDEYLRPVFVRNELIIANVKCSSLQVRALVIIEDRPLATLLRHAETVAHTEWSADSNGFKDRYIFGNGVIDFVQSSVSELLRIVNQAERKPDPSITIDFFSVPALPEDEDAVPGRRRRRRRKPGGEPEGPEVPPPAKPRPFRIDSLHGGFRIARGNPDAVSPKRLRVRAAYDVRRGNPFKKYNPSDFSIGNVPIQLSIHDNSVEVERAEGQELRLLIRKPDFRIDITGFDPDRDIKVDAKVQESDDGD